MVAIRTGETLARKVAARIGAAAATTAALTALSSSDRVDAMLVLVTADKSLWAFDAASSTAAAVDVLVPNAGTGRWKRLCVFEGSVVVAAGDALVAAGNSQATGLQLTAAMNNIGTCALGAGVNLPASEAGEAVVVMNNGANALTVYPKQGVTDTINGVAAGTGVELLPGSLAVFYCTVAGAWHTMSSPPQSAIFTAFANTDADQVLTGAQISGADDMVNLQLTGAIGAGRNLQLPTVANLLPVLHLPVAGKSYHLRVINKQAGAFAFTVTTNTGWTLSGTMTIAQNTWRDFVVTLTSPSAATLQATGATGTAS